MHAEAYQWLSQFSDFEPYTAVDLGGDYDNLTPRALWPRATWTIVNPHAYVSLSRPDVPVANYACGDARKWSTPADIGRYDLVICTEVFEHVDGWEDICENAYKLLKNPDAFRDPKFLITCAGPGRKPHNMYDGGELQPGEHYEYVMPHELGTVLRACGFRCKITYEPDAGDVYAYAIKH